VETAGSSETSMAITLDSLTSQKAIERDGLKYQTENVIFNVRTFNLKILQIFSVFLGGKKFEPTVLWKIL